MPVGTGNFAYLLAPGLKKVFFDEYREYPLEWSQVFKEVPTQREFEEMIRISGLTTMPGKAEHGPVAYDDPLQGEKVRVTPTEYALGFRVSHRLQINDLYSVITRMSKKLGKSARNAQEVAMFGILDDAFTGATFTGFDSLALCSTAHTQLRGGTQANKPATDADLSVTSLRAAVEAYEGLEDEDGMPALIRPRRLVITPSFRLIAKEILTKGKVPYSNDNTANVVAEEEITPFTRHYYADADSWFLLADKNEVDVSFYRREGVSFDSGDDFDTRHAKFIAMQFFGRGFGSWWGVYGSSGG